MHAELAQSTTSTWSEFLIAGDALVGVRFEQSTGSISTRYFTRDHLGSIAVITDESATVVERLSYDAWGKRRFPNGTDDPADSITSQTTRGFTGEENLDAVGLVHLNGRVYDPLIGRMMTADPYVPDPTNAQTWNRYSYVINNPLSITDPNGYCFLGLCSIGHFFTHLWHGFVNLLRNNPIIGSTIQIAATAICVAVFACGATLAALTAAGAAASVTGVTSGNLGMALKAGLIAGVTALAFNAVGDLTTHNPAFGTAKFFENVAGHALVGCASAVASGSTCQSGALSAGVSAAAGPLINDGNKFNVASLAANSVLGGLASVAGGGKFANGAVTAAFGYLFNASIGENRKQGLAAEEEFLKSVDPNARLVTQVRVYYGPDSYFVADALITGGGNVSISVTELGIGEVKSGGAVLSANQVNGMAEALKSGNVYIVNEGAAADLGIKANVTLRAQGIIPYVTVVGGNQDAINRQFRNSGIEVLPRGVGRLGRLRGGLEAE